VAKAEGADLIVMGTHGRTGLSHAFFGSVAEHVVRHSRVPVLTARDEDVA
jgi:nucleotide-binding universal stress UspA family protein